MSQHPQAFNNDRRKTLPVVKIEKDINEDTIPQRVLPILAAPHASPIQDKEESETSAQEPETMPPSVSAPAPKAPSAVPSWLKLNAEDSGKEATRVRHSVGLDVPGAVHTITTPSKTYIFTYACHSSYTHVIPYVELKTERQLDSKLVVIMGMTNIWKRWQIHALTVYTLVVGLPARGKSYLVKKLRRYLNWLQYETKVFNVGNMRRVCEAPQDQNASFFDPNNNDMKRIRDEIALSVLEQLIDWLKEGGRVAIHDATNSTLARRKLLIDRLEREPEIRVLLIESVCTDQMVQDLHVDVSIHN